MSGDPAKLIVVSWRVLRDAGPEAYVLEFTDGQLILTFGPMPKGVVEDFVKQRKLAVEAAFDRIIRKLNDGQNPPHQDEQIADQAVPQR